MKRLTSNKECLMRRILLLALLCLPTACSLFGSSQPRYVVFFGDGEATMDDQGRQIVAAASDDALAHPGSSIVVAGFADPSGTVEVNAKLIRARVETVSKAMTGRGLPASRIQTRDMGQVEFALNSQESRRVVISVAPR